MRGAGVRFWALFCLVVVLFGAGSVMAQGTYVITGSDGAFTAAKDGEMIGTSEMPIQDVINAIKNDASGNPCIIQFGNGTTTLDIGTAGIEFDGGEDGDEWGLITLVGRITSNRVDATIIIVNGVSINSTANIANTENTAIWHNSTGILTINGGTISGSFTSISNQSTGTVIISGGTVSARHNRVINNNSTGSIIISGGTISSPRYGGISVSNGSTGSVNITGGTISSISSEAIENWSTGKITISGDALVTSDGTATIYLGNAGTATAERLVIEGGIVRNTLTTLNSYVINNNSSGAVTISGGTISPSRSGHGIRNASTGLLTISGGTISARDGNAIVNSGPTLINGGTVSAISESAIMNRGSVTVSGGLVTVGGVGSTATTSVYAVTNRSNGSITVTGGTVSATNPGIAIYNNSTGTIRISGNALVTSALGVAAISLRNIGTATTARLIIEGGTVQNSSGNGDAIRNLSAGAVDISGGTVMARGGYAINRSGTGAINLTNGLIFAHGTSVNDVISGTYNPIVTAAVVAWNRAAGNTEYTALDNTDISVFHGTTAVWDNQDNISGIAYANSSMRTGFLALDDITVTDSDIPPPRVNAATPAITTQPQNVSVKVGDEHNLTAAANVTDGGILSYQWFTKMGESTLDGGEIIPGATSASYTIPSSAAGTYYYYVTVTNTNSSVDGNKTATTASDVATVIVEVTTTVLSPGHVIPPNNGDDVGIVVSVNGSRHILTAGPNPVGKSSGEVKFFVGATAPVARGSLTIYDASGNVVNKIRIDDNDRRGVARNARTMPVSAESVESRRVVGLWNLTDTKGRTVSEGTYLVRGTITTVGGKKERVSLMVGVR